VKRFGKYIGELSNNQNINGAIKKYKKATLRETGTTSTWTQWTPEEFELIKNEWTSVISQLGLLK